MNSNLDNDIDRSVINGRETNHIQNVKVYIQLYKLIGVIKSVT